MTADYDTTPSDWVDVAKIPDPDASKPEDWDESEPMMVVDPSASKPATWYDDEPALVADKTAQKPGDWDDDEVMTTLLHYMHLALL